jgi:hypothetical protein
MKEKMSRDNITRDTMSRETRSYEEMENISNNEMSD